MSEAHRGGHWARDTKPALDLIPALASMAAHLEHEVDRVYLEAALAEIESLRAKVKHLEAERNLTKGELPCWNCANRAHTMRPTGPACTTCAEAYDLQDYGHLHARADRAVR